jgi:hypothetical protein
MKGKKQNESDNELANKEQDVAAMHVRACWQEGMQLIINRWW